jgi:hypothetical protein
MIMNVGERGFVLCLMTDLGRSGEEKWFTFTSTSLIIATLADASHYLIV